MQNVCWYRLRDVMNLQLYISKKNTSRHSEYKEDYVLAIVDLDKASSYPRNFVCVLPQLSPTNKSSSAYLKLFGEESLPLAKRLLKKALKHEADSEVKTELQKRVDILEPKQNTIPCIRCGHVFSPKKFGKYQTKICSTCKTKTNSTPL